MAKADTVYSLFGMKSPYDVAREEMLASQQLLQRQTDPYAKLGTALGMSLGRLFGGVSPEMERAQQTEQAIKDVEAQIREAREQQAARIKTAEGIEPGPEAKPKSAAEQLLARSQEKSDKLRQIADLLESRGQSAQAARFSDLADKELGKSLTIQKQLADIAAKGRGKWSAVGEYKLPNGDIVLGGLYNNQLAYYGPSGKPVPMPPNARDMKTIQEVSTASRQAAAIAIENDPDVDQIPRDKKQPMANDVSLRAKELQAEKGLSQGDALQQAIQEVKPKYIEKPVDYVDATIKNIKSAFSFLTGDDDSPKTVRRKTADGRIAEYDADTKSFIRYVQ